MEDGEVEEVSQAGERSPGGQHGRLRNPSAAIELLSIKIALHHL